MMTDLPKNVRPEKDRHGKVRYRFRKTGYKSCQISGPPNSKAMFADLAKALSDENRVPKKESVKTAKPIEAFSLDDLWQRFKVTAHWTKNSARYQKVSAKVIERFLDRQDKEKRRFGRRPVARATVGWLDNQFGAMSETPGAANDLRKKLKVLLNHGVRLGWIDNNPVPLTAKYKDGEGHKDWTDAEIAQFRETHSLGSMARLTLELTLNVAGRACEVNKIERSDIRAGRIHLQHAKGSAKTSVPILSTTRAAIKAMPSTPIRFLVVTQFGKPFSDKGMSNRMRKWCDEAGLKQCSMHGLKKSISRQLVEAGATDAEGQAVTGHKSAKVFGHYRAAANQERLADNAFARVESEIAEPGTPENCRTSENDV